MTLILACTTCNPELQAGVFDASFWPTLLKVALPAVVGFLAVAMLDRLE